MTNIVLEDMGSFFVGGRDVEVRGRDIKHIWVTQDLPDFAYDPNGDFTVEQAYVQYFIPAKRVSELPVLLQHGGGLTGASWETTPDGRPGWLHHFLRAGFAVYVIDNVERGRAGWCVLDDEWPGKPVIRSWQEAWWLYRIGTPENYDSRTPFPGQRFPLAAFEAMNARHVPRWTSTPPLQVAALKAAIARIGRCVVIGHSQGGDLAQKAVLDMPEHVPVAVFAEPSGLPETIDGLDVNGRSFLFLMGDNLDATPLWVDLTARIRATADALAARGARSEYLALAEHGITGNSHMLMMDDNSDALAALVQDWILKQL